MDKNIKNMDKPFKISGAEYVSIQNIRDRLANTILICVAFLGAPLILISYLRYLKVGGLPILLTHLFIYLICLISVCYRRKIPSRFKSFFLVACSFIIAVSSVFKWGIAGAGISYFIFGSILVTIFFGVKPGILFSSVNIVILIITGILYHTGYWELSLAIKDYSTELPSWINVVSIYGCFTIALVVSLGWVLNSMAVSIEKLVHRTSELKKAKEQMEKEIKNREQAEKALQDSEEQFRVVLENLPVGVFVHDLEGKNLIVNDEACNSSGYSREELLGRTVEEFETGPFDMARAKKTWLQLVETGESMTFESVSHRKNGIILDTEIHLKSIILQGSPVILVIIFNISERKKAETALRESEERFRTVLENLPCGVSVHDLEGRHLIVNEETCRAKGYSREEFQNLTVMEIAGPDLAPGIDVTGLWKGLKEGALFTFEASTQRKDGSLYDSEVYLSKIMLEGQPVILSLVFDITERKKAEEELKKSEIYLRTLMSTVPDLIWLKDVDGKYLYCNPRVESFLGTSEHKIIDKTDYDFVDTKLADIFRKNDEMTMARGWPGRNEEEVIFASDGHREILETLRTPMYQNDGTLVGVLGIGRDITERKKIEENLARRSELERLISEISSRIVGMSHYEVDAYIDEALALIGKKIGVDHAYLFLLQTDKIIYKNFNEWRSDDSVPHIGVIQNIQPEKDMPWIHERTQSEEVIHVPDVSKLPPEAHKDKVYFENKGIKSFMFLVIRHGENLIGFLGFDSIHKKRTWSEDEIINLRIIGETFTNAIQRKQVEKEQERLQAQLATAVELAHLGPWELDIENQQFTFNDQFYKIYHTNAEEMGGYTMSRDEYRRRFIHPDDIRLFEDVKKEAMKHNASQHGKVEHRMLYADGVTGYVMTQVLRVKDSKGNHVKSYGVNQDITEWKTAQKKLRDSEEKLARSKKMESLGLLAGGVAHDLNNVLSGIVSYPELILLDLPEESKLRKPIKTIQESGNKAVAIVQDLLTIARGAAIIKQPLNLNNIINEYLSSPEFNNLKIYHSLVEFKTDLDSDLFNFSGSLIHIKKVIMNLVSNASEAIEEGGNVTISTGNRYIDTPISKYEDVKAGEYVVLSVLDDGPGISPENLDRIFEPFFTKKVMGKSGTGLGLTVVWNTVQDHSGYIDVKSDKNGTKFELYFPITREDSVSETSSVSLDELKGDGELILVVDDVASQREISCRMLHTLGYRYVSVPGGEEAIEYLENNKVDLILLDMIMTPGISGRETYEQIVKINPGQKAVIVSGYTETEDVVAIQKLGAGGYVKKPFSLETLGLGIMEELKK